MVPYHLFPHANLVQENWSATATALAEARRDTTVSIAVGGLITTAIMTTAAGTLVTEGIKAEPSAALMRRMRHTLSTAQRVSPRESEDAAQQGVGQLLRQEYLLAGSQNPSHPAA